MAGLAGRTVPGAVTFPPGKRPGAAAGLPAPARPCPPLPAARPGVPAGPGGTDLPGGRGGTGQRATSPLINTMKRESASVWASRKEKRPLNPKPEKQPQPRRATRGASGERRGHTLPPRANWGASSSDWGESCRAKRCVSVHCRMLFNALKFNLI